MIYLNVPFSEKDLVKNAGAKWDWKNKQWFIEDTDDVSLFNKWIFTKKTLTIELVPESAWFSNVRSNVSADEWKVIQKYTFVRAGYRCEICGGKGDSHPVECHEIWNYDDINLIQKLENTISLCPKCHEVKHFGLANVRGHSERAKLWLMSVNEWEVGKTEDYIEKAFKEWLLRSEKEWKIDISWMVETFKIEKT